MSEDGVFNHVAATIGIGAIFVWWGVALAVGPITIGLTAMGTGLILLAVNAARAIKRVPTKGSTTSWGIAAILWGALDHFLRLQFLPSCAVLLMVIGVVTIAAAAFKGKKGRETRQEMG